MKIAKKTLMIVLVLLVMLTTFGAATVFAEDGNLEYKVVSDLTGRILGINSKVTGTVDISETISNSSLNLKEGTENTYEGAIYSSVEAGDLFEGAYTLYKNKFYNLRTIKGYWRNIVMFGKTKNSFPTAEYTVKFPENITVDKENIVATENTRTISRIDVEAEDHSVKFIFYLGNWNDYEGFFQLFEAERNQVGHAIEMQIPYTVDVDETAPRALGTISGSGQCDLYKFGVIVPKTPIVSISSPEVNFDVINPR